MKKLKKCFAQGNCFEFNKIIVFLYSISFLRQSLAYERRERLRTRWNEIKHHVNPVYEQTS